MLNAEAGKIKIVFNMGKRKSVRLEGTFLTAKFYTHQV